MLKDILELQLKMEKATPFKGILEVLSSDGLFSKARFDFSKTEFKLQAMDTNQFVLVSLLLPRDAFDDYHCDRDLSVVLNLAAIAKACRRSDNDDTIIIEAEEAWPDTVTFKFRGRCLYFDFLFQFVGVPDNIPEIPESEYHAIVRMPSAKFMQILNQLSSFMDEDSFVDKENVVTISVYEDRVSFFSRGKTGSLSVICRRTQTVDKPEEPTVVIEMEEKVVSLPFELRNMISFSKASTLFDQVAISLAPKVPAKLEYKIADKGYIRYYMLPMEREMPRIPKEDKMENEGDEMQN